MALATERISDDKTIGSKAIQDIKDLTIQWLSTQATNSGSINCHAAKYYEGF